MATLKQLVWFCSRSKRLTIGHYERFRLLSNTQAHIRRAYSDDVQNTETTSSTEKLSFEEYRKLRKSLKWRGRIAGAPMGLLCLSISSAINVQLNPDMFNPQPESEIQLILGMDPVIFAVLCGAVSGIAGFAMGGVIFNNVWRFTFSKLAKQVQEREEDFLARLHKHRYSRFDQSNYEDDYYAEKVMTLSDYRQWIRQQQIKRQKDEELQASKITNKEEESIQGIKE